MRNLKTIRARARKKTDENHSIAEREATKGINKLII